MMNCNGWKCGTWEECETAAPCVPAEGSPCPDCGVGSVESEPLRDEPPEHGGAVIGTILYCAECRWHKRKYEPEGACGKEGKAAR